MASFRYYVWDPWLLLLQMLTLQCIYYSILSILVVLAAHAVDTTISLDLIFAEEVSTLALGLSRPIMLTLALRRWIYGRYMAYS